MYNYIFDFEQIKLRNLFFENPKKFFEDAEINPKYYIYKLFRAYEEEVGIKTDLKLETMWANVLEYNGTIHIMDLQGFAYNQFNCCNNMYFMFDEIDNAAWFCFSSSSMKFGKEANGPALYIASNPNKLEIFETEFDDDINIQYNFEFRFFIAKFLNAGGIYLPPLYEIKPGKRVPSYAKIINCEEGCKKDFGYDLRSVPAGQEYMVLCPNCLSFTVFKKEEEKKKSLFPWAQK